MIFFSVKAKSSDSHIWRSILKSREVLAKGLAMVVNTGLHAKFRLNSWLPCGPFIGFATRVLSLAEIDLPVACFCYDYGNWDLDSRTASLPMQVIQKIAPYSIDPSSTENDECFWTLTSSGEFTVKSAYESLIAINLPEINKCRQLWSLMSCRKVKMLRILGSSSFCNRYKNATWNLIRALRDC